MIPSRHADAENQCCEPEKEFICQRKLRIIIRRLQIITLRLPSITKQATMRKRPITHTLLTRIIFMPAVTPSTLFTSMFRPMALSKALLPIAAARKLGLIRAATTAAAIIDSLFSKRSARSNGECSPGPEEQRRYLYSRCSLIFHSNALPLNALPDVEVAG
jgi:hypothetical protein